MGNGPEYLPTLPVMAVVVLNIQLMKRRGRKSNDTRRDSKRPHVVSSSTSDEELFLKSLLEEWNRITRGALLSSSQDLEALPVRFESREEAACKMRKLILLEAIACLQKGFEIDLERDKDNSLSMIVTRTVPCGANGIDRVTLRAEAPICFSSGIANDFASLNLMCATAGGERLLAIISPKRRSDFEGRARFLEVAVLDTKQVLSGGTRVYVSLIDCGIVTMARMFMAAALPQHHLLVDEILGQRKTENSKVPRKCEDDVGLEDINASQIRAIKSLFGTGRVHLWHGPPGTGKSTTIVRALKVLFATGRFKGRVMVCGPSNQSVQVLVSKTKQERLVMVDGRSVRIATAMVDERILPGHSIEEDVGHLILNNWTSTLEKLVGNLANNPSSSLRRLLQMFKEIHTRIPETISACIRIQERIKSLEEFASLRKILRGNSQALRNHVARSNIVKSLQEDVKKIKNLSDFRVEREFYSTSDLLFCTLSVSGRRALSESMRNSFVDLLIVDEAAQALEAETWIALQSKPSRILLVGDPMQLNPTLQCPKAVRFKFRRSMLERLMEFIPPSFLEEQYRMHPKISSFPNSEFYGGRLRDAASESSELVPFPFLFIDVEGSEEILPGKSVFNHAEADIAVKIVEEWLPKLGVIVITPYNAQADLIRKKLKKAEKSEVQVSTVDSFQGAEADFVILSLVRANPNGEIGFLKDSKRLNVSMTRSKHGLRILGNASTLKLSNNPHLSRLLYHARATNSLICSTAIQDDS